MTIRTVLAVPIRHWRGEYPPVTAIFGSGLLLGLLGIGLVRSLLLLAMRFVDHLKPAVAVELIADFTALLVVIWALTGIARSVWRWTGRPSLWMSAALAAAGGVLGIFTLAKLPAAHENILILADKDPVGEPATVKVIEGVIKFEGTIVDGTARKVDQVVRKLGHGATLEISSEGGRILEAYAIADLVERYSLKLRVPTNCESACTLILVSSQDAVVDIFAKIGFHRTSRSGSSHAEEKLLSEEERDYLLAYGVKADFVEKAFEVPSDDMWYPEVGELIDAGVIDGVSVEQTIANDVIWIEDEKPWNIADDWLIVGASGAGRSMTMTYGFVPGSKHARDPLSQDEANRLSHELLCANDFYRPIIDHGGAISMVDVDRGLKSRVEPGGCV